MSSSTSIIHSIPGPEPQPLNLVLQLMKGVLDSMMNPESCRPVIDPFCKAIQV